MRAEARPLCVDLDETLIRSDLFVESFFALARLDFLNFFSAVFWLFNDRAYCKGQIVNCVDLDATLLPYNADLLAYRRKQRADDRKLATATTSDAQFSTAVTRHMGLSKQINTSIASTPTRC